MSLSRTRISGIQFPQQLNSSYHWEIPRGQCWGLIAEPGLGRSALLRALAGFNRDLRVFDSFDLDGTTIPASWSASRRLKAGIFYLPRKAVLFPEMNLWENLLIAEMPRSLGLWLNEFKFKTEATKILQKVGIDHPIESKASILTRSEQQLLGLARVFLNERRLILIDEATSNLSSQDRDRFEYLIEELKSSGVCVIYAIPALVDESSVCDKIFSLTRGSLTEVQSEGSKSFSRKKKIFRSIELHVESPPKRAFKESKVLCEFKNFEVRTPNETVLGPLNFKIYRGEIVGLLGPVEGGRLDLLLGLFGADQDFSLKGRLEFESKPIAIGNPMSVFSAGVSVVSGFQSRFGLFESQNLAFNLSISSLQKIQSWGFIKKKMEYQNFDYYKSILRMDCGRATSRIAKTSRFNLVKLLLARALLRQPRLVFLDEPMRGLSAPERAEIYYFVRDLADQGVSIILSSSSVQEQISFCDRIFILNYGLIQKEFNDKDQSEEAILGTLLSG